MATSSADIGFNSRNYVGAAQLGSALDTAIQTDTRPILQLMQYSFMWNREQREAKRADEKEKLAELGKMTALDWQNAIPKEREEAMKIADELNEYAKTYAARPNASTADKLEWMSKLNEAKRKVQNINARFISYGAWNEKIAKATTPAMKSLLEKERDEAVNSTTIEDTLPLTQEYKVEGFELPKASTITIPVPLRRNANDTEEEDVTVWNQQADLAKGAILQLQLDKPVDPKTPEGARAVIERDNNLLVHGTDILNDVFNKNKANNGGKLDESNLPTPAAGIIELAKKANAYSLEKNERIARGDFGTALKPYKIIKWEDGIQADELAMLSSFSTYGADQVKRKVTQTDNAIQKRAQDIDLAQLAETGRHNRASEGLQRANLAQRDKEFKASQKGSETQVNGAWTVAQRLYGELGKLADERGVISPDKIRKLNTEQLKYLGIEKPKTDAEGNATGGSVFQPLSLSGKEYAIELVNGEIRVMKPVDGETKLKKLGDGRYVGLYDPEMSTNIYNVATNRLNEELTKAGSKELNTYWGIDMIGGNTSFTSGTTSERSGTSTAASASTTTSAASSGGKQIKRSDIATKASAAGYTPTEYETLLKKNGIKILD